MTKIHDCHAHEGDCRCDDCEAIRKAWTSSDNEIPSLRSEVEKLKAENAALRELVPEAFKDGWQYGMGSKFDKDLRMSDWHTSQSKQRLDELAKGEG